MTKDIFIARSKSYFFRRLLFIPLVFVFLAIGAAVVRFSSQSTSFQKAAFQGTFAAGIVGLFALLAWYDHRRIRRLGLQCPSCSKTLIEVNAKIAIATDHCPHCGAKVFSNDRNA